MKLKKILNILFLSNLIIFTGSVFAQAKVELGVPKMTYINGDTCEIFIEANNLGDRQITLAIDFRINAKNGDFIKKSTRVFELRKGKILVNSVFADNEKCTDIGSLSIQDIDICTVEGEVIRNANLCMRFIQTKRGLIPIKQ